MKCSYQSARQADAEGWRLNRLAACWHCPINRGGERGNPSYELILLACDSTGPSTVIFYSSATLQMYISYPQWCGSVYVEVWAQWRDLEAIRFLPVHVVHFEAEHVCWAVFVHLSTAASASHVSQMPHSCSELWMNVLVMCHVWREWVLHTLCTQNKDRVIVCTECD